MQKRWAKWLMAATWRISVAQTSCRPAELPCRPLSLLDRSCAHRDVVLLGRQAVGPCRCLPRRSHGGRHAQKVSAPRSVRLERAVLHLEHRIGVPYLEIDPPKPTGTILADQPCIDF